MEKKLRADGWPKTYLRWDWKRGLWRFRNPQMFLRRCSCGKEYEGALNSTSGCDECRRKHEDLVRAGRGDAHYVVRCAIKRGALRPAYELDCADCGAPADFYDHRDYSKPLKVEPVCHGCNNRRGPGKRIPPRAS